MKNEELMMNNVYVGAGLVSAQRNTTKTNANTVRACIARPQEEKSNANAVGAESIFAQDITKNKTNPVGAAWYAAQGSHAMRALQINKQNAITLIALIISIIIMLTLAGITLNLTLGEHGIFKLAQNAGKNYSRSSIRWRRKHHTNTKTILPCRLLYSTRNERKNV